jgi:hypothetical protein
MDANFAWKNLLGSNGKGNLVTTEVPESAHMKY